MARIFGRPFQLLLCLLGLVVALLSVTGIYLWLKKRAVRKGMRSRHADEFTGGTRHGDQAQS
jgi:uncharacterized iron-regulated membrane protein